MKDIIHTLECFDSVGRPRLLDFTRCVDVSEVKSVTC